MLVTTLCQYLDIKIVFRGGKSLEHHHGGRHGCGQEDEADRAGTVPCDGQDAPQVFPVECLL